MRPEDWYHFLNLFFHFPPIKDLTYSNFRNNFDLIPLGIINNFMIFLHCNENTKTVIIESTKFYGQLEGNKLENKNILVLN
ncbi:MAG: hypothetical protein ACXAD7_21205, partial [Candidatus Kariarchaeaceae archaeon]